MSDIKALTGNEAIAYGVRLAKPKVIAAYPITPQTTIVETLANFVADGSLKAQFVESEGEHGAIFTVMSAAFYRHIFPGIRLRLRSYCLYSRSEIACCHGRS
jgi:TPP-dependent indolepyruvate ferredoxin oxidoreductase alpha subunit